MKKQAIERLLPGVYQAAIHHGSPLAALLESMEYLHERDEVILERIHDYFDPYLAPPDFVPFIAGWVDLGWMIGEQAETGRMRGFLGSMGPLRNLVAVAPELSRRRGTADGLRRVLEIATGVDGFIVQDSDPDRAFHIKVVIPKAAAQLRVLIERIVESERPVHCTYELGFEQDSP